MNRTDRFVMSHRPYAVNLSAGLTTSATDEGGYAAVDAAWFRRRNGVNAACFGYLWDYQAPRPRSVREFLERHADGRYGGTCRVRWDGVDLWTDSAIGYDESQSVLNNLLRPMLQNFPAVPARFDGWWTFR